MNTRLKLLAGVGATLTALAMAAPASAQSYGYTDRYNNNGYTYGYNNRYYGTQDRLSIRDTRLMDQVQQLISEVQARRYDLRGSFYSSELRNLQRIEDNIRQARFMGGLTERQYRDNSNLLDRLDNRFRDELRTARRFDDYDGRYANRY